MVLDTKIRDKIKLTLEHKFEHIDLIFDSKQIEAILLNSPIKVLLRIKVENHFSLVSTILVSDYLTDDYVAIDTKTFAIKEQEIVSDLYKQIIDCLSEYKIPKY